MTLGQVALTVDDLPRAVAFHRDVLGLPFLFQAGPLAFFDLGGTRLMLSEPEPGGERHPFVMYYRVANLQEEWTAVLTRGAKPEHEPHLVARMPDHELWMAFVRDPENRLTGLMSEVRK